jgi:hypothetical protein
VSEETEKGMVVIDAEKGVIPLPFDILKNPGTGLMSYPVDEKKDTPLTIEMLQNMNKLDGFISGINISVPVDFEADPSAMNSENIILFDVTDMKNPVKIDSSEYYTLFNMENLTEPPYYLTIVNKSPGILQPPKPFTTGGKYILLFNKNMSGKKNGVNVSLSSHVLFHLIKSAQSLFQDGSLVTDVLGDPDDPVIKGMALNIENMRILADAFFSSAKDLKKDDFPAVIPFSIKSNPEAVFLPGTLGNIVPSPNDLNGDSPLPSDVSISALIDGSVDASTISSDTVRLYKTGDFSKNLAENIKLVPPAQGELYSKLTMTEKTLEPKTSYIAFITSGIKNDKKSELTASTYFALARAKNALVACDDKGVCSLNSYLLDKNVVNALIMFGKDPTEASKENWESAKGMLISTIQSIESIRKNYDEVLKSIETGLKLSRENIVLLWTFTTGS